MSIETSPDPGAVWSPQVALAIVLGLIAVVFLLYHRALRIGFLSDDWYFLRSAALHSPTELFAPRTSSSDPQNYHYVPLGELAYWVEYRTFGLSGRAWHAVSFILHALNAFLVSRLARRGFALGQASAIGAGLFYAVSFVHYGSVVAVFGLFYLVTAFFLLVALLSFSGFLRLGGSHRYVGYLGGAIAALLTIEAGLVVLPLAALLELGHADDAKPWRRRLLDATRHQIPLALLLAAYVGLRAVGRTSMHEVPLIKVVGTFVYSLFGLFSFGIPQLYEQAFLHKRLAVLILFGALALVWAKGGRAVRLAVTAFVLAYSPHYFLSGFETRYFYIPVIFAAIAGAELASRVVRPWPRARAWAPVALAALAAFASAPYRGERIREFRTAGEITMHTLAAVSGLSDQAALAGQDRLLVVDAPGFVGQSWGTSFPAYVFRNGLSEALAFRLGRPHLAFALQFVNTGEAAGYTPTTSTLVSEEELARLAAGRTVVRFSRSDPRSVAITLPPSRP